MKLSVILSGILLALPGSLQTRSNATSRDWQDLKSSVGGRLIKGVPFSSPCFSNLDGIAVSPNLTACGVVRTSYDDERTLVVVSVLISRSQSRHLVVRSNVSGAYMITQWETCQRSAQQCLLDYLDPENPAPSLPSQMCNVGSIPNYFVRRSIIFSAFIG